MLGFDGKPRPDFRWDDRDDLREPVEVLREDGVRFDASGSANRSQRITAAELSSLIDVLDDDAIQASNGPPTGLVGRQEWDWDRYVAGLGLPNDRVDLGRELVNLLSEAIAERGLPWQAVFRKGYVAFQRSGGYNTLLVDVYWRKPLRLAVKLPDSPTALSLTNPYPDLEESWGDEDREWGWTLDPLDVIPDLRPAVEIAERVHPTTGPATKLPAPSPLPVPGTMPSAEQLSAHKPEVARVRTGRTKKFYATGLRDLVAAGVLSPGAVLRRKYRGTEYEVVVRADGRLEADGEVFESASQAAGLMTGQKAVNGWAFWLTESGVPLGDLRPAADS